MEYSFKKGYLNAKAKDQKEIREKIMKALNVNRQNFYNRMNGLVEPKLSEAKAIESIFAEHNIKDIWGA